MMWTFSIRPE